jgi:hypothetical protein
MSQQTLSRIYAAYSIVEWGRQTKEISMRTKVGLWIDHRKAIIVSVTDKGEEVRLITSKVEKQLRRSGDSPLKGPFESLQVPESDSR